MQDLKKRPLNAEIIQFLAKKLKKTKGTIRKDLSLLHQDFGNLPLNSVAQIYARQHQTSVITKLTPDEKAILPHLEVQKPLRITQKALRARNEKKLIEFVKFDTNDPFVRAHLCETNKSYTFACYTAAFMLCRKIIENLLVDSLRTKYPPNKKENVELYFDTSKGRVRDFSEILGNLRKCAKDFGTDKGLVERIVNRANIFKDDANDKTHSWYHIVRGKKEIDDHNIPDILSMIEILNKNMAESAVNRVIIF